MLVKGATEMHVLDKLLITQSYFKANVAWVSNYQLLQVLFFYSLTPLPTLSTHHQACHVSHSLKVRLISKAARGIIMGMFKHKVVLLMAEETAYVTYSGSVLE